MPPSLLRVLRRKYGHPVDPAQRREFLKMSLAASAGLLISGSHARAVMRRPALGAKRVVVIGGGFGGLACAYELKSVGYDVSVIEARPRLGGRVLTFTDFVKGRVVEGGAELVGSNHPAWVGYKEKFGLEFLDMSGDEDLEAPILIDGKLITAEEGAALAKAADDLLATMNEAAAPINEDEPWLSPKAEELDAMTMKAWLAKAEAPDLVKTLVAAQLVSDNGVELDRQSLLGNLVAVKGGGLEKYWTETEVYRCKGGNQQLAAKLAEGIGAEKIVTGLPVMEVAAKGSGMVVTCKDSRTLECDDVVLAVPPSVWDRVNFTPGLPTSLAPQMGVNVKYLCQLKSRYWKGKKQSQYAVSNGLIGATWEQTDAQEGDENPSVCCFSGGDAARKAMAIEKASRDGEYAKEMEVMYPGYKENFVASRFMDWPKDPWTMASYSFPAPGQVMKMGPVMRKGIGNLHFAGEHACYKFVGYMEGGLNSGASVAKRLAARDGVAK